MFLKLTAYIGVDIFFFVSAYSLGNRSVDSYKEFILNRFYAIYTKYIIFALISSCYKHWSTVRLFKVICGIELLEKGGGAYLWFIPAIMMFYILYPLLQHCDKRNRTITLLISSIVWFVGATIITKHTSLNHLTIIWNRIPIFYLGYYTNILSKKSNILKSTAFKITTGVLLLIIGTLLLYRFGYKSKLNTPFIDMYYIMGIPLSIGLIFILDNVPETKLIKSVGASTLEMYAIQMTFGYVIVNKIFKFIGNSMLTNIISLSLIIIISIATHYLYELMNRVVRNRKGKVKSNVI